MTSICESIVGGYHTLLRNLLNSVISNELFTALGTTSDTFKFDLVKWFHYSAVVPMCIHYSHLMQPLIDSLHPK